MDEEAAMEGGATSSDYNGSNIRGEEDPHLINEYEYQRMLERIGL